VAAVGQLANSEEQNAKYEIAEARQGVGVFMFIGFWFLTGVFMN